MNLDELVQSIPDSENALREELACLIVEWKRSAEPIEKLDYLVDKWHGNVWFQKIDDSNAFYRNWCKFKKEAISGINGMTVNERLYVFGLLELWGESNDEFRANLRNKVKVHV
ncbi:MAG: hypothetical protein V4488_06860 [Pseudomonadota bacterium]